MKVSYLADLPHFLPTVAHWLFKEWGYLKKENTVETVALSLSQELNTDAIPLVMIVHQDKQLMGVARLSQNDLKSQPGLSPWLASVLVSPKYRAQGIGTKLVNHITDVAQNLGETKLFLKTEDKIGFYAALGWSVLDEIPYSKGINTIMYKSLKN